MKSINKLILFFMLIFIGTLLTANANDLYASAIYTKANSNPGIIQVVDVAYPTGDTPLEKVMKLTPYFTIPGSDIKNWNIRIKYRRPKESASQSHYLFIIISEDNKYGCNMNWDDKDPKEIMFVSTSKGTQYYINLYKKVADTNLPSANGGEIIEQVGETHSVCSYTDSHKPLYFQFTIASIPALNLISIKMVDHNYNGEVAYFANSAYYMYASM